VQETQRLLNELGARALCLAVAADFSMVFQKKFSGRGFGFCHFNGFELIVLRAALGISVSPSSENMRYFNIMILGPAQSPYEGTDM
jgi:hypothetical protein